MKKIFIIYLCSVIGINSFGQVSIGNSNTPNSNVILDPSNGNNKGLLLPRTNPSPNKPLGNVFYNSNKNMIGVVVDTSASENYGVNYLSPWKHTDENSDVTFTSDIGKVIITNTDPSTPVILEIESGDINIKNGSNIEYSTDVNDATSGLNGPIPSGGIIMWSGYSGAIPTGWKICDGTNNTPNLTGRFIVGYNGTYGKDGATGGSNTSVHTHSVDPPNTSSTTIGNHSHTGTTDSGGGSTSMTRTCCQRHNVAQTNHTHSFTTNGGGSHSHNTNISAFSTGGSTNLENRPPYWALAFIMKK